MLLAVTDTQVYLCNNSFKFHFINVHTFWMSYFYSVFSFRTLLFFPFTERYEVFVASISFILDR